ncbi:hypothetical protein [Plantibacter flavus]|uniref:ApeA N-terminal domain 1-containing protein n=1 Tax=Plantibacter flavus TaxID=150123 RepID=UPI0010C17C80|nr:hypothetical protein [Plantibacter flavus]
MTIEQLATGSSLTGLIVDGVAGTPYAAGTLRIDETTGPLLEVPYIRGDPTGQFDPVHEWFSTRTPPTNLILRTSEGDVSLFDVSWFGHSERSGRSVSLGKLRPSEIVLDTCKADLSAPLMIAEVRSQMDGLREWTEFSAIAEERTTDEHNYIRGFHIDVSSEASLEWLQGDARMTLQTDWRAATSHVRGEPSVGVFEWVVLDSAFNSPVPFLTHLVEHQKIKHLLVLMFDGAIHFRQHRVKDESFAKRHGRMSELHLPFVELISRRTIHEYAASEPDARAARMPLVYLDQIGAEGLTKWSDRYEAWERFILPTVGVLGRQDVFVEDLVVSLSMSVEAAGHLIGVAEGEVETYGRNRKPSTATHIYRCLRAVDVAWGDHVESIVGLARASADVYNSIKHFDRGQLPDHEEMLLISLVLRHLIRLTALNVIDSTGQLLLQADGQRELSAIHARFSVIERRVRHDGRWEQLPVRAEKPLPKGFTTW